MVGTRPSNWSNCFILEVLVCEQLPPSSLRTENNHEEAYSLPGQAPSWWAAGMGQPWPPAQCPSLDHKLRGGEAWGGAAPAASAASCWLSSLLLPLGFDPEVGPNAAREPELQLSPPGKLLCCGGAWHAQTGCCTLHHSLPRMLGRSPGGGSTGGTPGLCLLRRQVCREQSGLVARSISHW